jgi:hypothetical protein
MTKKTTPELAGEIVDAMIERGDFSAQQVDMACEALKVLTREAGGDVAIFLLISMIRSGELKDMEVFSARVKEVKDAFKKMEKALAKAAVAGKGKAKAKSG